MVVALAAAVAGCEGIDRKHDPKVADIQPPKEEQLSYERSAPEKFNFPDLVEDMMSKRQAYLDSIQGIEHAYLTAGDSARANWARHQRAMAERVESYPYLTALPAEHSVDAAPESSIPEADALFSQAETILNSFRTIPLAGALENNKNKAREALAIFKRILKEYPKSDKVDDCAFWCGDIYKEYLREEDPDDELSVRYYKWAVALDPNTPHPARFQCAVVYDFRKHDRTRAIELYHQVLDTETFNASNVRFSATRVEQLTDEEHSHVRPYDKDRRDTTEEPMQSDPEDATATTRRETPGRTLAKPSTGAPARQPTNKARREPPPDTAREPDAVSNREPSADGEPTNESTEP